MYPNGPAWETSLKRGRCWALYREVELSCVEP